MVHTKLLALGHTPGLLDLANEFTDSSELFHLIQQDSEGVLRSRGIRLPADVVMTALEGEPDGAPPILRFEFPVQRSMMVVDYDTNVGISTRLTSRVKDRDGVHL